MERVRMDIHSKPGTSIIFAFPTAGHENDQEKAKKYLKKGKRYTIAKTEVHKWYTDVYLTEIPGIVFNSVMFSQL